MSDTQLIRTAREKTDFHEYDEAEKLYRQYLEENPAESAVWKALGDILITQQKYYDAIEAYSSAVENAQENPEYLADRGCKSAF
jgi:cytochrome c-type biogenesis protein CcmH/NrfG